MFYNRCRQEARKIIVRKLLSVNSRSEIFNPEFGVIIEFFGRCRRKPSAIFNVFAYKSVDENFYFEFYMFAVHNVFVFEADFQKLAACNRGEFFRRKEKIVGTAQKFIVFVVFLYVIEERIGKTVDVLRTDKARVVEKLVDKFVFVVLGNAVNVVVMRVKRSAVNIRAFYKFRNGYFVYLLFFGEHLRER